MVIMMMMVLMMKILMLIILMMKPMVMITSIVNQVEMGLTWIDHDVIEVPVEEIEVGRQRQIINFF